MATDLQIGDVVKCLRETGATGVSEGTVHTVAYVHPTDPFDTDPRIDLCGLDRAYHFRASSFMKISKSMSTTQEKIDNMKRELSALEEQLKKEKSQGERKELISITLALPRYDWELIAHYMNFRRSWCNTAARRGLDRDPFEKASAKISDEANVSLETGDSKTGAPCNTSEVFCKSEKD